MVKIFDKDQINSIKKHLLMAFIGTSILSFPSLIASDLETSASSHEDFELTEKFLKPTKWKLHADISDEQWKCLPTKVSVLDISEINHLSEAGLKKIASMEINTLNLSNLKLVDENLQFLPKGLEKLSLKNTLVKGYGLKYLPETLEELDISDTIINIEFLKELLKRNITINSTPTMLYDIAIIFRDGIGIDKDVKKCINYCERAGNKGSAIALNQLGIIYELGIRNEKSIIVPINTIKAEQFYKKAAELGLDIATKNLARIKENNEELIKLTGLLEQ